MDARSTGAPALMRGEAAEVGSAFRMSSAGLPPSSGSVTVAFASAAGAVTFGPQYELLLKVTPGNSVRNAAPLTSSRALRNTLFSTQCGFFATRYELALPEDSKNPTVLFFTGRWVLYIRLL